MRKWHKPGIGNKKFRTADRWFSAFIRLRDTNEHGHGRCITCEKITVFHRVDAGHYQTRNNISTRFDEKNVHGQCWDCNREKGGQSLMHGSRIKDKYGIAELFKLDYKSRSMMKLLPFEVKDLTKEYRIKARALFAVKSDWFKEEYKNLVK